MLSILDLAEPTHTAIRERRKLKVVKIAVVAPVKRARRLHRRHKTVIHLLLIAGIIVSLATGAEMHANWLFVALGIIVEIN